MGSHKFIKHGKDKKYCTCVRREMSLGIFIDGRQRLLTIPGFVSNDVFNYWNNSKLQKLKVKKDLNGREVL